MYYSKATKKNFEEFNALYKKIDREDCIPDHIASVVLKHIRNTANKSKVDNVYTWYRKGLYLEVRSEVDITAKFYKVNIRTRLARLSRHLATDYKAGDDSDSDGDFDGGDDYEYDSIRSFVGRIRKI